MLAINNIDCKVKVTISNSVLKPSRFSGYVARLFFTDWNPSQAGRQAGRLADCQKSLPKVEILTSRHHRHAFPQSEQKISEIFIITIIIMMMIIASVIVMMMMTWVRKLKKDRLFGGGANSIGTWFLWPISIWGGNLTEKFEREIYKRNLREKSDREIWDRNL